MALKDLLAMSSSSVTKQEITEERLRAILPALRDAIAWFREYPDIFVDIMCGGDDAPKESLKLYFYQRVFLRAVMRHRYAYATFPRAYSKSFLSVMALMCRCVLYPGAHLFVTSGGKEQGASIL
jgi:hypothetical protein